MALPKDHYTHTEIDEYNPAGIAMTDAAYFNQVLVVKSQEAQNSKWETLGKLYQAAKDERNPVVPDWAHIEEAELAKEDPDYDLIAEARIILEVQKPKPTKSVEKKSNLLFDIAQFVVFLCGVAVLVYSVFFGGPPALMMVGAAFMGLPYFARNPIVLLCLLLLASTAFAYTTMGDSSSAHAEALRRAQSACRESNLRRMGLREEARAAGVHIRFPLIDCQHLQDR